jgi:hypothetical protein
MLTYFVKFPPVMGLKYGNTHHSDKACSLSMLRIIFGNTNKEKFGSALKSDFRALYLLAGNKTTKNPSGTLHLGFFFKHYLPVLFLFYTF